MFAAVVVVVIIGVYVFRSGSVETPTGSEAGGTGTPPASTPGGSPRSQITLPEQPSPNASEGERKSFYEAVEKLAEESKILDLTGCVPAPAVVRVKLGGEVTLAHHDANARVFGLDKDRVVSIPPGETRILNIDFDSHGIYGFGCAGGAGEAIGGNRNIGFLFVVPK